MRDEDLPPTHHLRQWHTFVFLPVLDCILGLDHDHEVVLLALEVDLRLYSVAAHLGNIRVFKASVFD